VLTKLLQNGTILIADCKGVSEAAWPDNNVRRRTVGTGPGRHGEPEASALKHTNKAPESIGIDVRRNPDRATVAEGNLNRPSEAPLRLFANSLAPPQQAHDGRATPAARS